jgi:hypothetical protein
MELHSYVTQVQEQLETAAALGDDHTRQTAAALATAAAPAMRLALLAAVSAAADEITAGLLDTGGAPAVSVHLEGDDLRIDVRSTAAQPEPTAVDDGDASARISLRLSETLKTDIEAAARRDAVSVNSWLVRAATGALGEPRRQAGQQARFGNTHHVTGWING